MGGRCCGIPCGIPCGIGGRALVPRIPCCTIAFCDGPLFIKVSIFSLRLLSKAVPISGVAGGIDAAMFSLPNAPSNSSKVFLAAILARSGLI